MKVTYSSVHAKHNSEQIAEHPQNIEWKIFNSTSSSRSPDVIDVVEYVKNSTSMFPCIETVRILQPDESEINNALIHNWNWIGGSILLSSAFTTIILISIMYLRKKCQHACFDAAVTDYPRMKKTNYDDISISISVNDKVSSNNVCVAYGHI